MNAIGPTSPVRAEIGEMAPTWAGMTSGEQIRFLEVEGYLVLPGLLDAERIFRIKSQVSGFSTDHVDYSVHQRGRSNAQFPNNPAKPPELPQPGQPLPAV